MKTRWIACALVPAVLTAPASAQCQTDTLVASDGESFDNFAFALALEGDTAVIGAPGDDFQIGSAYVFERTAFGWAQTAQLAGGGPDPSGSGGPWFGFSVALSGGTIFVGEPYHGGVPAVFIYERTVFGWTLTQELPAPVGRFGDFGQALSLDGDRALVGDPAERLAYVYERRGTTWTEVARLSAEGVTSFVAFGGSVALSGDTALVGAPGQELVYVFEPTAGGWSRTGALQATGGTDNDQFGTSLAIEDGTAVVGAYFASGAARGAGAAYVFEDTLTGWAQTAEFSDPEGAENDFFGLSVALRADRALVLSPGAEAGFVYGRESGWNREARLTSSTGSFASEFFGLQRESVALDGDTLFVGGSGDDGIVQGAGAAHVFALDELIAPYCFCEASAPCGNEEPFTGCTNGTGEGALLAACGTTGVAADDLVLIVTDVPASQFGLVFMGAGQTVAPFGNGQLCVAASAAGFFRFPVQDAGSAGVLTEGPGIVAHSQASFGAAGTIASGQTWNFQAWYRDPSGPCSASFNFSNATSVTFGP